LVVSWFDKSKDGYLDWYLDGLDDGNNKKFEDNSCNGLNDSLVGGFTSSAKDPSDDGLYILEKLERDDGKTFGIELWVENGIILGIDDGITLGILLGTSDGDFDR